MNINTTLGQALLNPAPIMRNYDGTVSKVLYVDRPGYPDLTTLYGLEYTGKVEVISVSHRTRGQFPVAAVTYRVL